MKRWRSLIFSGLILNFFLASCLPLRIRGDTNGQEDAGNDLSSALIAFIGTDGNIYTSHADGADISPVTDDALYPGRPDHFKFYQYLVWSPDGTHLGFVGVQQGVDNNGGAEVYTASISSDEIHLANMSDEFIPFYLYWSPNSEYLSYLSSDIVLGGIALHNVSADGGNARLVDRGNPYYWVWSPDSSEALVHVGGAINGRLEFLGMNEGTPNAQISLEPSFFQAPSWSPSGEHIYLAIQNPDGQGELVEAGPDGKPQRTLASFDGPIAFALNADGEKLAYLANVIQGPAGFLGQLRVIPLDNPDQVIETGDPHVNAFFWSPDGEKLAYLVPVVIDVEDRAVSLSDPQIEYALKILDTNSGENDSIATFRPTEDFLNVLPFFDQYHLSTTIWSPDSHYVVISALNQNDIPSIQIVPVSGQEAARTIAEGSLAFWSWK
jgi:WD40-like Beta Propeller Repeat